MKLNTALAEQAKSCAALGSPFMEQLLTVLSKRLAPGDDALRQRLFGWPGDLSPSKASVPLRLAGGLHALLLNGDSALTAVYPPHTTSDDALWAACADAFERHETFLLDWLQSPPQTNEVRRSCVLIAAGHWLSHRANLDIRTSELGASAGLNLNWDQYGLDINGKTFGALDPVLRLSPDWSGPLPPNAPLRVVQKRGVDINPLDPKSPRDALRLRAYLWPDQPHRLALTNAAIAAANHTVEKGDAIEWLADQLTPITGQLHLIYHTIAWQYFPAEVQTRGRKMIEDAGSKATGSAPLAWLSCEADDLGNGAAITLRLWPGDLTFQLGRADFHGRWVDWLDPTNA